MHELRRAAGYWDVCPTTPEELALQLGARLGTGLCAEMFFSVPDESDTQVFGLTSFICFDLRHFQPNFHHLWGKSGKLPAVGMLKEKLRAHWKKCH